jgi:hypothetical protein
LLNPATCYKTIVVGAVAPNGKRLVCSNDGRDIITVMAPGGYATQRITTTSGVGYTSTEFW